MTNTISNWSLYLLIALGGAFGASFRFYIFTINFKLARKRIPFCDVGG